MAENPSVPKPRSVRPQTGNRRNRVPQPEQVHGEQVLLRELQTGDGILTEDRFARNRALIMQMLHKERQVCKDEGRPYRGLTYEQIRNRFTMQHGFTPTVGNRCRELRAKEWVTTEWEQDEQGRKRLHVYPVE